jgi:hypothetical protein
VSAVRSPVGNDCTLVGYELHVFRC